MEQNYENIFSRPIIKYGRITLLFSIVLCFIPAIYLAVRYHAIPPVSTIFTAWFMIASIYGVEYFMTPISYFPILGVSGTYLAFLSGNIANMRVPCAIVAQQAVGVKPATKEGELVATLGMAGSVVINIIVVTLCAIAGNLIISILPPIILTALDYVLSSIFGGLFTIFAVQYPKYAVWGLSVALLLLGVVKVLPTWAVVVLCSFTTIGFALVTSKRSKTEEKGEN